MRTIADHKFKKPNGKQEHIRKAAFLNRMAEIERDLKAQKAAREKVGGIRGRKH
jgi:hypothetical protein